MLFLFTRGEEQRFVSDASHELRAPLTAIQGNLELLRRQRTMSEAEREETLAEAEIYTCKRASHTRVTPQGY
jgi:signal transduction histidine kinase